MFRSCFYLTLLAVMAGCPYSPTDPQAAYENAVRDAEVATAEEISTNLIPITPTNGELIRDAQGRVLMVTWTSWDGYAKLVGEEYEATRDIWVTAAPQVQDFCRRYYLREPQLTPRLEQLLGLPPDDGKTLFVEIWVQPEDLFRPSPDPEITDGEAELDFPMPQSLITISAEYVEWFTTLMGQSYGEQGYPWTRLGYTYDWGNPWSEVGLSEFVIGSGAVVTVASVTPTAAYCSR